MNELILKKKKKQKEKKKIKEIVLLTQKEINEKLARIMEGHIGQEDYITKNRIFHKIFGDPKNYSNAQLLLILRIIIPRAMNWLRKTSKCFIVHKRIAGYTFGYFLPKTRKDIKYYKVFLENLIKKCRYMQGRSEKAVAEGWYREFQKK